MGLLGTLDLHTAAHHTLLAALLAAIAWLLLDYGRVLLLRRKLPPGPWPLPIVGNHFQTPSVRPWIAWEKWGQYYNSPILTLWIGRYPRILINDAWVASDLLEKKADVFSSRPRLVVMGDAINCTTTNQTTLPYGDRWRLHRKLMVGISSSRILISANLSNCLAQHAAVGSQAVRNYRSFQGDEAKVLMRDLLEDPNDFELSIERYTISVTSIVGWGRRVNRKNDYVAQQALKIMESVNFVVPGLFLMEAIPAMLYLPSWLYKLPSALRMGAAIVTRYFLMLTDEGAQSQQQSFAKYMLNAKEKFEMSDYEVAGMMANLIGGGVDTTSSTMLSCILALACFPQVQRKAQEEMDRVIGRDRSPTWEDIDQGSLPYLTALVKEVLRWRTVTALAGIPHANTKDIEYKGYYFPAGTSFTGNTWAIHRNPRDFPDPDTVRPERFLGELEHSYPNSRGSNPFGWGRRQCSGQPLAEQGLLFSLGRLIWAFNVQPGLDDKVTWQHPMSTGEPGLIVHRVEKSDWTFSRTRQVKIKDRSHSALASHPDPRKYAGSCSTKRPRRGSRFGSTTGKPRLLWKMLRGTRQWSDTCITQSSCCMPSKVYYSIAIDEICLQSKQSEPRR